MTGRPRDENPSKAALQRRRQRARKAAATLSQEERRRQMFEEDVFRPRPKPAQPQPLSVMTPLGTPVALSEMGDRRAESNALDNLGLAHAALGETRRAIEHCQQALSIAREIGDRLVEGVALILLMVVGCKVFLDDMHPSG